MSRTAGHRVTAIPATDLGIGTVPTGPRSSERAPAPADRPMVTSRVIEQWMAREPFVGTHPPPQPRVE